MISEFADHGLQENKVVSKVDFASYLLGDLTGRIIKSKFKTKDVDFRLGTALLHTRNSKAPYSIKKSLLKKDFIEGIFDLDELSQKIYAALLAENFMPDEANNTKVLAGYFSAMLSKL